MNATDSQQLIARSNVSYPQTPFKQQMHLGLNGMQW
jgi:hypothetical protein